MSKADNKQLEESIIMFKKLDIGEDDKEFKKARNVILKELKRLQEENKKMKTEIAEHIYWESTPVNEIKKMYIPKDKVKEKLEEIKLNKNHKYTTGTVVAIMNELEELLKGKKNGKRNNKSNV